MDNYHKNYYQNNKEEWYKKIICDVCGGSYCKASRCGHFRTQKHINALQRKNDEIKYNEMKKNLEELQKKTDESKLNEIEEKLEKLVEKINSIEK